MDNASKNATDMIDRLTMQYNRGRQAAITNELVDIITGTFLYHCSLIRSSTHPFLQVPVRYRWSRAVRIVKCCRYRVILFLSINDKSLYNFGPTVQLWELVEVMAAFRCIAEKQTD